MDATTDERQIRAWAARWPDANLGIVTGLVSGLLVLDTDNRGDVCGGDNLAALAATFGPLPDTLTAITGNGKHLYFQHPGGTVKNSIGKLAYGVDVKADGGYVVAPPSMHANGNKYRWEDATMPVAELPDWLAKMISKEEEKRVRTTEHNPFTDAPTVKEGERNDTLYKLGCILRGQHAKEYEEIVATLLEYNKEKCQPPLQEGEVITIAESTCKHPPEMTSKKSAKRLEQSPVHWFKFRIRDWFADPNVMLMDDRQTGWYIRLMALAWSGGGFITADPAKLWRLAKATSREAFEQDCELVLSDYEVVIVDGQRMLKHPRLAADYVEALESCMNKMAAGMASKAAKQAKEAAQRLIEAEAREQVSEVE